MRAYTDADFNEIPRTQGLYAFYLDTISPTKVGLLGDGNFGDHQLERAKNNLISRIRKLIVFMRSSAFGGTIKGEEQSLHISRQFQLKAQEIPPLSVIDYIELLPPEHIYSYLQLANHLALFAQPIYVGITKEQTLYDRYAQHKRDHESGNDTSKYGVRLRMAGFDWDDVIFSCVEFRTVGEELQILSALEKHLQAISTPILSLA